MFFVGNGVIVKIDRLPGESNKSFFKKGYYIVNKDVCSDAELKKAIVEYNNVN